MNKIYRRLLPCFGSRNSHLWFFLFVFLVAGPFAKAQFQPHKELGSLFHDVQTLPVFADSKTFTDCVPTSDPAHIVKEYHRLKSTPAFDLKEFVLEHFSLPPEVGTNFKSDTSQPVTNHIRQLWPILTRAPSTQEGSLLPLPHPYVVPGGRFREIYYWDSYFTMLGLLESGEVALIQNMVDNFSHLIETIGHIPNGNRSYYTSRSQPPFFALMLRVLAKAKGPGVLKDYAPILEKEYAFWMDGANTLNSGNSSYRRVVLLPDGSILNRYWDDDPTPRPEAYKEDIEVAHASGRNPEEVYRNIRAAAESGWDFSSRWFKDSKSLETIRTTDLIPVDLNTLLYHMEITLAEMAAQTGDKSKDQFYKQKAKKRKKALLHYCWNQTDKFFYDYDFVEGSTTNIPTLAAVTPLFFCMATPAQAKAVGTRLKQEFLKQGGLVTTLNSSGQQWDAPNGWAPLQWMGIQGLKAYGMQELATSVATNWINQNLQVYKRTGKLTEKYNVEKQATEGGGGEYPNQDGFGWTNGVLLKLLNDPNLNYLPQVK